MPPVKLSLLEKYLEDYCEIVLIVYLVLSYYVPSVFSCIPLFILFVGAHYHILEHLLYVFLYGIDLTQCEDSTILHKDSLCLYFQKWRLLLYVMYTCIITYLMYIHPSITIYWTILYPILFIGYMQMNIDHFKEIKRRLDNIKAL